MKNKFSIIITLFLLFGFLIFACSEKRNPLKVKTHPDGWLEKTSENYHGKAVLSTNAESCKSCHGDDFSGGTAKISCASCHQLFPHPEGILNTDSEDFHGKIISQQLAWDLTQCKTCHGLDYSGGDTGLSCLTCHVNEGGPEACNTCHGSENNFAPPEDLSGNDETTAIGVGAHQAHLNDTKYTTFIPKGCDWCHEMPLSFSSEGHIDNTPNSEIHFSLFASDSGNVNPLWTHESATCENVYCHGAFQFKKSESGYSWAYTEDEIKGNNATMLWTNVDAGQDSCGSCHSLPPTGHVSATGCSSCHSKVVDADLNIIDKKLHINGNIDVF